MKQLPELLSTAFVILLIPYLLLRVVLVKLGFVKVTHHFKDEIEREKYLDKIEGEIYTTRHLIFSLLIWAIIVGYFLYQNSFNTYYEVTACPRMSTTCYVGTAYSRPVDTIYINGIGYLTNCYHHEDNEGSCDMERTMFNSNSGWNNDDWRFELTGRTHKVKKF